MDDLEMKHCYQAVSLLGPNIHHGPHRSSWAVKAKRSHASDTKGTQRGALRAVDKDMSVNKR